MRKLTSGTVRRCFLLSTPVAVCGRGCSSAGKSMLDSETVTMTVSGCLASNDKGRHRLIAVIRPRESREILRWCLVGRWGLSTGFW